MAHHAETADRVRRILAARTGSGHRPDPAGGRPVERDPGAGVVEEKTIVGGSLGFLVGGHLCCAARDRGLTVRVGPEARAAALAEPHVVPHRVGSRETSAFVVVEPEGYVDEVDLARWVDRALAFVATLD